MYHWSSLGRKKAAFAFRAIPDPSGPVPECRVRQPSSAELLSRDVEQQDECDGVPELLHEHAEGGRKGVRQRPLGEKIERRKWIGE